MKGLHKLTVKDASKKLASGEITSVELVTSCLDQIEKNEPEINAFITVTKEQALKAAAEVDKKRKKGEELSGLAGIPYSMKDVYCTCGIQTTAGSKILEGFIPPYNATVYQRLIDADAVLLGKTNCDPFGFGASTEHSAYGVTRNPVDTKYVPGGSSGGSGAAVKYGGGLFSIAEDTGGSIRCPSSFCGVTGLKPTYGRVSRYGAIAFASSFDSMGPIAKNAEDAACILEVIAGKDPHDATSAEEDVPHYSETVANEIKGKTIGVPPEYFGEALDKEVKTVVEESIEKFEGAGCKIKEISLPNTKFAIANYYVICMSEASSNLARYDGIRYGQTGAAEQWREYVSKVRGNYFSNEEKRRIMMGSFTLSAGYADEYYKTAQKVRELLKQDFLDAFKDVDVIITPTMPFPPFKLGEKLEDPIMLWLADAYTAAINPTGLPALSVPAGETNNGLPIGMQLIAPHFKEDVLLNFGHVFEQL